MQDLNSKLERTHDSEPKALPLQEKLERIRSHNQPSYALIDKATQQADDQVLQWIPLAKCSSRYQECTTDKTAASLRFSHDGSIKVTSPAPEMSCVT